MDEDLLSLPRDWERELLSRGDLVRSFEALQGIDHFWAEAWRGRIRSYELDFASAWEHFDRAEDLAQDVPMTLQSLAFEFFSFVWRMENAILESPLHPGVIPSNFEFVDLRRIVPEEMLREWPSVRLILQIRSLTEGTFELQSDRNATARRHFGENLGDKDNVDPGLLALTHLGIAAAFRNERKDSFSRRSLERGALLVPVIGDVLTQGRVAGLLSAFHAMRGDEEKAREWESILLDQLPCPLRTREAFLKRARLVLERCRAEDRLLLI